jgi:hypothetical protein
MQMTNKTQRHLSRNLTACHPLPNGISAVTIQRLSRGASAISAVTTRYLNRERAAEMPSKVGYFRSDCSGVMVFRFDFAGSTCSMALQGSCVPAERDESSLAVYVVKDIKNQKGLMV